MAKNQPDERLVYLALNGVFKGENSKVRNLKPIRKLITNHKTQLEIRNLIEEYNLEILCNVAKTLLEQQIFESTLKAKIQFPEVFEVSPNQSAERAISEKEAVRSEQVAIESVTRGQQDGQDATLEEKVDQPGGDVHVPDDQPRYPLRSLSKTTSPSLYPVYLSFETQHQILIRVQQILESAIYAFAQKKLGGVLQREGWDCAEAVELNRWPRILQTHNDELKLDAGLEEHSKSLNQLLDSITQIRHTAVHRVRRTANTIVQFIVDAESFVKLLRNENYVNTLSMIRRQTQYTVGELERNKDLLETRLAETRKQLAAKRAELERQEKEAVENTVKEDREYMKLAGATLIDLLQAPATVVHSQASTEVDFSSDVDFDEQSNDEAGPSGN